MASDAKEEVAEGEELNELMSSLPKHRRWSPLCRYGGFWMLDLLLPGTLTAQRRLVARPDDVILATSPKSGTTWLKALVFSIVHRGRHHPSDPLHPIRTASPHSCIKLLEECFGPHGDAAGQATLPSPRIWSTHIPYSLLPESVRELRCRIIYVSRDPKDNFVSLWHFVNKVRSLNAIIVSLEEAFDQFCEGVSANGPIWEHALEYSAAASRRPEKVLLLRYEEMKGDPVGNVRKLAWFLGFPFSEEEERQGVAADISELCSFSVLSKLEVNKEGRFRAAHGRNFDNSDYFRRGEVGDWVSLLTPEMGEKLDSITAEKLRGTSFKF